MSTIARPHAAGETVLGVVSQAHCFHARVESHDRQHRTERLFSHDAHMVIHIGQHRGCIKVRAEGRQPLSANKQPRALRDGILDVLLDDTKLALVNQRSEVSFVLHAVAYSKLRGLLNACG